VKRENIEFLIGFLDALRRDDRDAVRAALKPEIVWQGLRPDLVCHGADESPRCSSRTATSTTGRSMSWN